MKLFCFSQFICTVFLFTSFSNGKEQIPALKHGTTTPKPQPEVRHVHLAIGDQLDTMVVTWSSLTPQNATVFYGKTLTSFVKVTGASNKFVDGGSEKSTQYIHKVELKKLQPNTKYFYKVMSLDGKTYEFTSLPIDSDAKNIRFGVYGDLGYTNSQSMPYLLKDVADNKFDAILHIGDYAYDLSSDNGRIGDKFMQMIEPLASRVPYMTLPGNHENAYNFSNYKARFNMPTNGDGQNMYYSFNVGPAHFVFISTEFYYYVNYGIRQLTEMFNWLIEDLTEANKPENRKLRPWIILAGHRPVYCSNANWDCFLGAQWLRWGLPYFGSFGMDDILFKYGVDLAIFAHEHTYERTFPIYNGLMFNGSNPYLNPGAPIHLISGCAGNQEGHNDHFLRPEKRWSAKKSLDFGYGRMTIHNKTHISFEQLSVEKGYQAGEIIDSFTIEQNYHGPFNKNRL